jgi:hypothetical protein
MDRAVTTGAPGKLLLLNWLQYGVYQKFNHLPLKTNVELTMDFNVKNHL